MRWIFNILLSVFWIAFFFFARPGRENLSEGMFFLIQIDKTFIQAYEPEYSGYDLWRMNEGTLGIFGITFWLGFGFYSAVRLGKAVREKKAEQIEDGNSVKPSGAERSP